MCNLYRMTKSADEVAQLFSVANKAAGANLGGHIYPGYPGLVIAEGALRPMNWGFPLLRKGRNGQALQPKPVNNARADKLESFFWRDSFLKRRCLIPVSSWAEAQGEKGAMTRTWMSQPDNAPFAVAGIWRVSDEWGPCYSMVMTDAAGLAAEVHSRMPVLLTAETIDEWTSGDPEAARQLCVAYAGELAIDRTDEPWAGGAAQPKLF